jgi:predicted aspartyl protease
MLAQQQQINLTAHARCFTTSVKVNGRRLTAMVDSDATGNFMARALVEKKGYPTQKKPDAYNLMIVDGNPLPNGNERVNKETKPLSIAI